ncbi:response regulator transcription factor [Desulfobacula sp.]|uniref:response regulator n=1 Tax=Desulfobacula sp. TaxID=2593537 RepID=UPI0025B94AAB|nr:response regulator transcription factor [Desulfobacula sp.]MBC2705976.1 response regulator transcription factor [Desulfobacula sp.]
MEKKIKIIIADDHTILRHGICQAFDMEKDFTVIGQADSGRLAVSLALEHCPDIVLMDVSMPDLNGIEATKQILANNSNVKVIALSMYSDKIYVMGMLNAGASGYLLKSCSFKELVNCIHTVLSGELCFCPEVTGHLNTNREGLFVADNKASVFSLLSNREREVLQLIAEGHKTKKIAQKLGINTKTVETHRTNLKNKLNIHSIARLTKLAITEGITSFNI